MARSRISKPDRGLDPAEDDNPTTEAADVLDFQPSPLTQSTREYYVSYAWGDDSLEGKQRSEAIETLCKRTENTDITVLRDIDQMRQGERISRFHAPARKRR